MNRIFVGDYIQVRNESHRGSGTVYEIYDTYGNIPERHKSETDKSLTYFDSDSREFISVKLVDCEIIQKKKRGYFKSASTQISFLS